MTKDETIRLFREGKEEWNKWAKTVVASREDTDNWDQVARTDFEDYRFEDRRPDFSGFIFPGRTSFKSAELGNASFKRVTFYDDAVFDQAVFHGEASFEGAVFEGMASFSKTVFKGSALFSPVGRFVGTEATTFKGSAQFSGAVFESQAWFSNAMFERDAQFIQAIFDGWARLDDVKFREHVQFTRAVFKKTANANEDSSRNRGVSFVGSRFGGQAWFDEIVFNDYANFQSAIFENDAFFSDTKFLDRASFLALRSDRVFSLYATVFRVAPNFIQAHFIEAPLFDFAQVTPSIFEKNSSPKRLDRLRSWPSRFLDGLRRLSAIRKSSVIDPTPGRPVGKNPPEERPEYQEAKWRALRRLAVQGYDHEREQKFLSWELWSARSRIRCWLGVIYWAFSRHGRSPMRPVCWWLVLTVACGWLYLEQSPCLGVHGPAYAWWHDLKCCSQTCSNNPIGAREREALRIAGATTIARQATNLALRNSLFDLESGGDAEHVALGCLYGFQEDGGGLPTPVRPRLISFVMVLQKVFAAVLLFLFGLSLRHMLRVK